MSVRNRTERAVRRGMESKGLWNIRSMKDSRSYDRWMSGLLLEKHTTSMGMVYWSVQPTGHGLIHKGRKP